MAELRKDVYYPHPPEKVWVALTDPRALAEWLMPNDFEPTVGHTFRFHVDPAPGMSGITECVVKEVAPPRRLVYTWTTLPKREGAPPHEPMTLTWTLEPEGDGTRLRLLQEGIENINWWWRFSMRMGWGRYLKSLMPKVLANVADDGSFTPGAITKRCYGMKTVPDGYAK